MSEELKDAISTLEGVLCDPDGRVVVDGSDGDRREMTNALNALRALAKREAVAVPEGFVMVEIGYLPDRCIAAARRDAAIVAKVAPNDDCAIISAAINAYLIAASQQAANHAPIRGCSTCKHYGSYMHSQEPCSKCATDNDNGRGLTGWQAANGEKP